MPRALFWNLSRNNIPGLVCELARQGKVDVLTPAECATKTTRLLQRPVILSWLLALATLAVYYPVHRHPFINYDDRDYIYQNDAVESGLSWHFVGWAFTTSQTGNWHPLTWLSHELDYELFGLDPAGHHDVNVLFHIVNAVLLFWVLLRATGFPGRSFMVAALFALHPINVESVAWIAERKTVLSMMFFLLALGAYRRYASQPHYGRYAIVAALFALGLMAKPQIIALPCVLLLWDYWPLQRMSAMDRGIPANPNPAAALSLASFSRLILEKIPLLMIAAVSAVITLRVQQGARTWYPRSLRAGNAILSYARYLMKAVWPTHLALLYPHPGYALSWWKVSMAALALLAITTLVILQRRRRYLLVGWFWFLGTLVPTLGIVQVGFQAMADRYAYVSLVGLFIMMCWGAAEVAGHFSLPELVLPSVSITVLLLLAILARQQIGYWQSDEVLWTHTLQVTKDNWVAESSLGTALAIEGKTDEAERHLARALGINPYDASTNMDMATLQLQKGNFSDAVSHYQRVLKTERRRTDMRVNAWLGMAQAYLALGEESKAQACFLEAREVALGRQEVVPH